MSNKHNLVSNRRKKRLNSSGKQTGDAGGPTFLRARRLSGVLGKATCEAIQEKFGKRTLRKFQAQEIVRLMAEVPGVSAVRLDGDRLVFSYRGQSESQNLQTTLDNLDRIRSGNLDGAAAPVSHPARVAVFA